MADLLLIDPTAFATHSAKKIGELIGVSETMVIRFCYAIGYDSFTKLQNEIREFIFDLNTQSVSKLEDSSNHFPSFYHTMVNNTHFIKEAAQHLNYDNVEKTIEKLNQADYVFVSGTHASYSMAHWFSFSLNLIRGKTLLFRPEFDLYLDQLTYRSVLFVFSFYRYAMETLSLAEFAKKQGAFVIAVTDSPNAPITKLADITHDLQMPKKVIYQTAPIVFAFLNALLISYTHKFADQTALRKKLYGHNSAHQFYAT